MAAKIDDIVKEFNEELMAKENQNLNLED